MTLLFCQFNLSLILPRGVVIFSDGTEISVQGWSDPDCNEVKQDAQVRWEKSNWGIFPECVDRT
jgi:hypothetical protein